MSCPRRIVEDGTYHVMSRIAHRGYMLTPEERTLLLGIMKRSAEFCGVELIGFCVMSNHFHALVHVPPARELSDEEYVARYEAWKGGDEAAQLKLPLNAEFKRKLRSWMFDLSKFMQLMKEWYTTSYNDRTGHTGTLWEGKFKSVLVESDRVPLTNVLGYIDLNPVRAGMVKDPGEYAWSSYGEASRMCILTQRKYTVVYGLEWAEAAGEHRKVMEKLEAIRGDRPRIRAFTDGVAVGSEAFVEAYFERNRGDFPAGRKAGAKAIRGFSTELRAIRELR